MRPQLYKVYKFSLPYQRHHFYQIAQCHLIIKDLSSKLYRLSFGRGCGGRFEDTRLLTSLHLDESTGLLEAIIHMGEVAEDTDSWTQLVLVFLM